MKEADRILIDSLISVGLELEDESVTLEQFSPDILINATSLCLEYIFESRNEHQSFPKSCPVNMASRYKVGQALSEAIKSLGYKDALGYQSFLYPNVKDSRNIISVLIVNLPKDSGPSVVEGLDQSGRLNSVIKIAFSDNWKSPWLPFYCRDIEAVSKPVNCSYRSALMPFESERIQPVSAVSPGAAVAASGRGGLSTDIERTTMRKVIAQRLILSKGQGRRVQRCRGVACDGCSWRQGIEQQRPDPAARQGHRPGQFVQYGDHYLHLRIAAPNRLTNVQRALLLAFAETEDGGRNASVAGVTSVTGVGRQAVDDTDGFRLSQIRMVLHRHTSGSVPITNTSDTG